MSLNSTRQKMEELMRRKLELEEELRNLQQQIFNDEEQYIQNTWNTGNIIKGFDGFISNKHSSQKKYKIKEKDRIFSGSSFTRPGGQQALTTTQTEKESRLSFPRVEYVDDSSLVWDVEIKRAAQPNHDNNHQPNHDYDNRTIVAMNLPTSHPTASTDITITSRTNNNDPKPTKK